MNILRAPRIMAGYILVAARNGQKLPQLTIFFVVHLVLHIFITWALPDRAHNFYLKETSTLLLIISAVTVVAGYTVLILIYRHSVRTIFNRRLPPSIAECIPSFGAHLSLLKPLEVMFRYATARFRVLPDILVLGEVRCGTTTLCHHLSSIVGCHAPFCLWKHPELDHKETFYFVGHFLGRVDPLHYRMCFPLAITKWFHQRILGRPFFCFDGCAQNLSHPAASSLIAQAYRDAGQPSPILVACVRNPVDQAVSWWKYENSAMLWGNDMGLSEWNTELRSCQYPPTTIASALDLSMSNGVEKAYQMTERLFQPQQNGRQFVLPPWAMTWPGGQLCGIGRNGCYATNIKRYERAFAEAFPDERHVKPTRVPSASRLHFVNVVPLEFLADGQKLKSTFISLLDQIDQRQRPTSSPRLSESMSSVCGSHQIHRNASGVFSQDFYAEPTPEDLQRLEEHFAKESSELGVISGLDLDWMQLAAFRPGATR